MQTISSATIRFNAQIAAMRAHFNKDIVTRQEVLAYKESGNDVPTKFWTVNSIGRGVYKLPTLDEVNTFSVEEPPVVVEKRQGVTEPVHIPVVEHQTHGDVISHFQKDSMIPRINPNYVEWGNFSQMRKLLASKKFFTLYITGESGSGKNEMISQACAIMRKPMVRVVMTRDTKEDHLVGSKTLVDGNIKYEEGPVIWAAENGACLVVDEISLSDPNEIMCLQNILEGGEFFVKSLNRTIKPAPGFCVIATDNTKGRGSDSGRYMGTNILNDAFLERFMMTMEQGYPSAAIERQIFTKLMDSHGVKNDAFLTQLVNWIQVIRKSYMDEAIEEQITTRRGCHIVNVYCMFASAKDSIALCTNRFDDSTKEAIITLWEKIGNGEKLDGMVQEQEDNV